MSTRVWLEVGTGRVDIEGVGGEGLNNTSLWEEPASAFIDCLELRSEEREFWEPMENKQGTAHRQRFGVCVGVFVLGMLASCRYIKYRIDPATTLARVKTACNIKHSHLRL